MNDETEAGPAGAPDGKGHPPGGRGQQSPLQARARFIKNWGWDSVIRFNLGACKRGGAQHGFNIETQAATARAWEEQRKSNRSLQETLDFLRHCCRRAPFLFFNGNTFAEIARELTAALFADLPPVCLREATSAVACYVDGVLDRESMREIVDGLVAGKSLQTGDRVKTLHGSPLGTVVQVRSDGRVSWRPDGWKVTLLAFPEALIRLDPPQ